MWPFGDPIKRLQAKGDYPAILKALAKQRLRAQAIQALVNSGPPCLPALLDSVSGSTDDHQETIMSVIEQIGPKAIGSLAGSLRSDDKDKVAFAVVVLVRARTVKVVPELLDLLSHKALKVVTTACWAICFLADERAIAVAAKTLRTVWLSTCPDVVDKLRQDPITNRYYRYGFIKALRHDDAVIRTRAAAVLGAVGGEPDRAHLLKAFKEDPDGFVRLQAGLSLIHLFGASVLDEASAKRWARGWPRGLVGARPAAGTHGLRSLQSFLKAPDDVVTRVLGVVSSQR